MAREASENARAAWTLVLLMLAASSVASVGSSLASPSTTPVDEAGAEAFVRGTLWTDRGTAVDYPGHVVFPVDSKRILDALAATGGQEEVDPEAAARAAASLQQPNGGFKHFLRESLDPAGTTIAATGAALALVTEHGVDVDEEAAEEFLRVRQNLDGGFGATRGPTTHTRDLPGSFVRHTYYAVLGLDALNALDSETRTEVHAFLRQAQNPDGGWGNWRWDDTSETSTTYFAVQTLELIGQLTPDTKAQVARFLEVVEDPVNGGFHEDYEPPTCYFCSDEPPSVPATGRALVTLAAVAPADAASKLQLGVHAHWLAERQVDEGPLEGAFALYGEPVRSLPHRAFDALTGALGEEPLPRPFPRPQAAVTDWSRNTALAVMGLQAVDEVGAVDLPEAREILAGSQHEGTGGFGSVPGYLEEQDSTAAAFRALDRLGRISSAPSDGLAATMAEQQQEDGSIPQPRWDLPPELGHTSDAIEALAHADRLDAVDTDAAAAYVAAQQGEDGGFETDDADSDFQNAWKAVRALDRLGQLDRIDRDGLATWLAGFQQDDGRITQVRPGDSVAAWDTARSLRTLEAVGRLDAVDVDAAVAFLAGWQNDDGSFDDTSPPSVPTATHVVLALDAVNRLDAIDQDGARSFLLDKQRDHGGFTWRGFPLGPNPMVRHAMALDALAVLGAL